MFHAWRGRGGALVLGLAVLAATTGESSFAYQTEPAVYQAGYRQGVLTYRARAGRRTRGVYFWYPTQELADAYHYGGQVGVAAPDAAVAPGTFPLLVFSHGFGGAGDQTIFLMEALARAGYVVAALNHYDSSKVEHPPEQTWPDFTMPETWNAATYLDRKEDVKALLTHLTVLNRTRLSWLYRHADTRRIGALGHSLGGYTVLGMSGAQRSWRDRRIKATLALSPYVLPYLEQNLRAYRVPTMLQGGTWDFGVTPFLPPLYAQLPAPKYFLVLKNATHFEWTNLVSLGTTTVQAIEQGNPKWIVEYSMAFFDRHLKGEGAELLSQANAELASYEFDLP